jgi:hypothetical protein
MIRRAWWVLNAFVAGSVAIAASCGSDSSDTANDAGGVPQGCTAGQYHCDGDVLRLCNSTGTALEDVTTCAAGMCREGATTCGDPTDGGAGSSGRGGGGGAGGNGGTAASAGAAGAAGSAATGGGHPDAGGADGGGEDAGGSAGAGGADGGDAPSCTTVCATEASLSCSNPDSACVRKCNIAHSMTPWCTALVTELYNCLASKPASSFECGTNGRPKPVHGTCDSQQTAARSCLYDGPVPDMTSTCAAWCQAQNGLACAESNCQASCMEVTSTGACTSAQASWILCASKQTLECDSDNYPALVTPDVCSAQTGLELQCFMATADGGI